MKTIVTSIALAALLGLVAPATSQAEDAHHGGGHYSSHGQSGYGHGGYQSGHSGYSQHGYQSGYGYGHTPSYSGYGHGGYQPSYGHGGYQSGYGHGGYQPSYGHSGYQSGYGHVPSHNGGHISLPGIHFSFGGHGAHH